MNAFEQLVADRIKGTVYQHYEPHDAEAIKYALFEWADMEPLDIEFLAQLLAALNKTNKEPTRHA